MVWQVPQEPPSPPGEDAGHGNKANHDQRKTKVSGRARPLRDGPPDMQHGQQAEENAGGDKVRFHKVSTDRCMRPMVIILNWKVKVSVGAQAAPQGQFMKRVGTTRPLVLFPRAAKKRGRGRPRPWLCSFMNWPWPPGARVSFCKPFAPAFRPFGRGQGFGLLARQRRAGTSAQTPWETSLQWHDPPWKAGVASVTCALSGRQGVMRGRLSQGATLGWYAAALSARAPGKPGSRQERPSSSVPGTEARLQGLFRR